MATSTKPVIAVAFYSTWGHIQALAEEVIKGVESTGATVKPFIFQETLPEEVRTKMYAAPQASYPVITADDLLKVDGLIIGAPTRYGRVPAQVSNFFDSTGQLWASGALVGKPVTLFTSTAGQHGGHETTALTTMPFFIHHGMIYVPIGFTDPQLGDNEVVQGGSPYGASTVAGSDGSRKPLATELKTAQHQGTYFANFVTTLHRGKQLQAADKPTATNTDAAREIPTKHTQGGEKEGYALGTPVTDGLSKEQTSQAAQTTKAPTPAPAPAPKAATPAAAPAAKTEKKKGGFFASCCGDGGIDK